MLPSRSLSATGKTVHHLGDAFRCCCTNDLEVGDRYYDLAKFLHTLDFSVEAMDKGAFEDAWRDNSMTFDHPCRFRELLARDTFWKFVMERGYDRRRIELINALIFLNMSALYEAKLGHHLYWMGRYLLQVWCANLVDPGKGYSALENFVR